MNFCGRADAAPVPECFVGVRAVLDQEQPQPAHDVHDAVHVGHVPAHVAHDEHLGPRRARLALEVFHVDAPLARAIDEHGLGARVVDHGGHGQEREGVGEYLVARAHAGHVGRDEHGAPARVGADGVLEAVCRREALLELRRAALRSVLGLVAIHDPAAHGLDGHGDALLGHGLVRFGVKVDHLGAPLHDESTSIRLHDFAIADEDVVAWEKESLRTWQWI